MSYTIDEHNPERQHLLAEILNPLTRQVLTRLPKIANARCLDLGCGQGNTTRYLADVLRPAVCIGLEYDARLVDYANTRPENPPGVRFQQGDATQLTFGEASFDLVFCRYLLIHMADPMRVVREMMRVVRPGGYAIAFEADFAIDLSYPECPALLSLNKVWQGVFQNPAAGRKLVHYFREAGASEIDAGALMHLEHKGATAKRVYRLTAEATAGAAVAKGVLTTDEAREMIAGLTRMEDDPSTVVVKFPDMWVIAKR
jgi:ubiquinone/menaquinone biosynthesis C-methylase UbiE